MKVKSTTLLKLQSGAITNNNTKHRIISVTLFIVNVFSFVP